MAGLIFYNRRGGPNNGSSIVEVGRVSLKDGEVQIEPETFNSWLRTQRGTILYPLDPTTGEAYIESLKGLYSAGQYFFVKEQSSGGANPGGAERA